MLQLYYSPGSIAFAPHVTLAELGVPYEAIRIDFGAEQQRSAQYMSINPKGRVPALVTDHGVLTETPAVLAYLAQTHPQAGLAMLDDPFAFARVQSFNNYLCSTVHVAHAHGGRGHRWAENQASMDDMKAKVTQTMTECFALIESEMIEGPWVMGQTYTICDPYLFAVGRWLEGDKVDRAQFPKVEAQAVNMLARPAVQRAMEEHFG
ncbi:MAG: glutathione S-transferase [Gammaproteobacteria bacterium]|jgi:glutathione S-transferase